MTGYKWQVLNSTVIINTTNIVLLYTRRSFMSTLTGSKWEVLNSAVITLQTQE